MMRTLSEARVPFEVPRGAERAERLRSVLEVLYLIVNEGYAATAGEDWLRPELCEDAMRLGRTLAALAPDEPEVHGLVALMQLQASRTRARTRPGGEPVLLLDQDRSRWDRILIARGLAALDRAYELGGALGPYALQAAIAACHARARTPEDTDWERIAALYDALAGDGAVAGGRDQPRRRARDGVRAGGRPCRDRRRRGRSLAFVVPPAPGGARAAACGGAGG